MIHSLAHVDCCYAHCVKSFENVTKVKEKWVLAIVKNYNCKAIFNADISQSNCYF